MTNWMLHHGDCREVLRTLPDNSVDSVTTDPPYGIRFMGAAWDGKDIEAEIAERRANPSAYRDPASINGGYRSIAAEAGKYDRSTAANRAFQEWCQEWGAECLRVLKPGGYLVSFGSPRLYHRMTCGLEDAGFVIKDGLMWLFGCLSDDTEILVDGQWEPYHKATAGRLTLCYNMVSDTYEWQPIQELLTYDYCDTAYRIQSDSTDQIVSRNHRCLVERGGSYAFQYAETLQQQARVPVLENLHDLLAALPLPERDTGAPQRSLLENVRQYVSGTAETWDTVRRAAYLRVSALRWLIHEAASFARRSLLQPLLSSQGQCWTPGPAFRQWQGQEATGQGFGRATQSGMEGRRNRLQEARQLYGRALRALSSRLPVDGAQGWLRDGASSVRGSGHRAAAPARRGGSPQGSPTDEQCPEQFATLRQQPRPQTVRASRFTRPDLATVEPIHYEGVVWCVRVPSGAFVARRNGHVFVTGNSGFPKSLNLGGGVGTALKPGYEPIVLAQKPLQGTYAGNMARWGVGGLNIDGCRIGLPEDKRAAGTRRYTPSQMAGKEEGDPEGVWQLAPHDGLGRWPANVILDSWDERVLRLRYNIPDEVSTVIREYFDGYSRLPAMPQADRSAAKPRQSNEILLTNVLREVVEREPQRHEASHVWQETLGGIARQNDGAEAGDREKGAGNHQLEGGQAHIAGLRDDCRLDTSKGGASSVLFDGESQQPEGDPGTSPRDGALTRATTHAIRNSPPQERDQERQPSGKSGNQGQRRSQEGTLAGASGIAATPGRERATVPPALYVLECDLPHQWHQYFESTGITVPSPDSAAALLDLQSGTLKSGGYPPAGGQRSQIATYGTPNLRGVERFGASEGGASRFFYCAKASRAERDAGLSDLPLVSGAEITDSKEGSARLDSPRTGAGRTSGGHNTHPTVKPVLLMRWLVRLVTPEGGTVLDPFAGSGTTLCAAIHEGRSVIGIEMTEDYLPLIRGRAAHAEREVAQRTQQAVLPLPA